MTWNEVVVAEFEALSLEFSFPNSLYPEAG